MFFMNPGSAVVEIIPFPLCNCASPDFFFGVGGYYHGSASAQAIRHYHYCVPEKDVVWSNNERPNIKVGGKCSWKHLHGVDSLHIDPTQFVALMRSVERDMIIAQMVVLTQPVINMNPNANGRRKLNILPPASNGNTNGEGEGEGDGDGDDGHDYDHVYNLFDNTYVS